MRVMIVEQAPGRPFNRGALLNIGFRLLAPDTEYVCLHDVDRVPVSADYRWPERPCMIIHHGLALKPKLIRQLLSSVVLAQNQHFAAANGFSNGYWGWGYEDVDLRERLLRCGLPAEHREGTFRSLPHPDLGSEADGAPTPVALRNRAIFLDRWFESVGPGWRRIAASPHPWPEEGLNSPKYVTLEPRRRWPAAAANTPFAVEQVLVDLPGDAPPA